MYTNYPFPYDLTNLLGGAVRIVRSTVPTSDPTVVPVPTAIEDVIDVVAPYHVKTGWEEVGMTRDAFSYSRGFDAEGWEYQNVAGAVLEEVTGISRSFEVSFAEFRPEHLRIIENAPAVGDVNAAPAAGETAQKVVKFGNFTDIESYRWAFISRRNKKSGSVVEPGGKTRGRFFMGVAYVAQLSADEVTFEQAKGAASAINVTFSMFPDPTIAVEGEEYGGWWDELAGAIA